MHFNSVSLSTIIKNDHLWTSTFHQARGLDFDWFYVLLWFILHFSLSLHVCVCACVCVCASLMFNFFKLPHQATWLAFQSFTKFSSMLFACSAGNILVSLWGYRRKSEHIWWGGSAFFVPSVKKGVILFLTEKSWWWDGWRILRVSGSNLRVALVPKPKS